MKKITLLLFLSCSTILFSQSKEFTILDAITIKPIDLAQILYPNLEIGSVSNEDGRVKIPLKKEKIIISHINYETKELKYSNFIKKDTIYLILNTSELDEIVVYNIDILKKVTNILDNTYTKEYSTKKAIHKSTYKETFSVNDSLSRLFQVQLDWWSKNYLYKSDKPLKKQNIFNLEGVDYSKIKSIDKNFTNANGAYVTNDTFFSYLHLNYLLNILKDITYDYEINSMRKTTESNIVYFDAIVKEKGINVLNFKNCTIVFDKEYKSIQYIKLNMLHNSKFKKSISETTKLPYEQKITNHIVELSFKKLKNKKLSLSYYSSELNAIIKRNEFTNKVSSKQQLFISKTNTNKKLKRGNIDIDNAFYKSIPNNIKTKDVKILLTKKEQTFLDAKN